MHHECLQGLDTYRWGESESLRIEDRMRQLVRDTRTKLALIAIEKGGMLNFSPAIDKMEDEELVTYAYTIGGYEQVRKVFVNEGALPANPIPVEEIYVILSSHLCNNGLGLNPLQVLVKNLGVMNLASLAEFFAEENKNNMDTY